MAVPNRRDDPDEQRLIERHIDLNYDRYGGRAHARLRDSGVSVRILVAFLRLYDGDAQRVAESYDLSLDEMAAALLLRCCMTRG